MDQRGDAGLESEVDGGSLSRLQALARLAREDTVQQYHLGIEDLAARGRHVVLPPSVEQYRALRFYSLRELLGRRLGAAVEYEVGRRMANQADFEGLEDVIEFLNGRGLGQAEIVSQDKDAVVVDILESAAAAGLPDIGETVCHLEAGLICRAVEKAIGRFAHGKEMLCCARGDDRCRFLISCDLAAARPPEPATLAEAEGQIAVEIMAALSGVASEAMRLAEELRVKNAELALLATTDPLTELANRRALIARLEQETERSRRYSTPMAIAMVDLDNFKLVNDTYGHDVGDQVLRRTANAIRSSVRSVDLAARYGGEEFTVLFPHLTLEQAVGAMERCRAAIADDTAEPRLTVSVGVAASPPAPADLDVLLSLADQALYAAKQSGKNRVVAAPSALDIKGEHAA